MCRAPNVYFVDRKVINLEAEVVRSRRIKCSCCGIKGAALGCYEKSCRKSFHVTCAMKIPQCRWDTVSFMDDSSVVYNIWLATSSSLTHFFFEFLLKQVNFVLLCPLHFSSKLPNEIPRPREIQSSSKEEYVNEFDLLNFDKPYEPAEMAYT